jgi:hypothetical protein
MHCSRHFTFTYTRWESPFISTFLGLFSTGNFKKTSTFTQSSKLWHWVYWCSQQNEWNTQSTLHLTAILMASDGRRSKLTHSVSLPICDNIKECELFLLVVIQASQMHHGLIQMKKIRVYLSEVQLGKVCFMHSLRNSNKFDLQKSIIIKTSV